jgi:hypothetical protein
MQFALGHHCSAPVYNMCCLFPHVWQSTHWYFPALHRVRTSQQNEPWILKVDRISLCKFLNVPILNSIPQENDDLEGPEGLQKLMKEVGVFLERLNDFQSEVS